MYPTWLHGTQACVFPQKISGKNIGAIGESTKLSDHQLTLEHFFLKGTKRRKLFQ